jgi:hypothetical protein
MHQNQWGYTHYCHFYSLKYHEFNIDNESYGIDCQNYPFATVHSLSWPIITHKIKWSLDIFGWCLTFVGLYILADILEITSWIMWPSLIMQYTWIQNNNNR